MVKAISKLKESGFGECMPSEHALLIPLSKLQVMRELARRPTPENCAVTKLSVRNRTFDYFLPVAAAAFSGSPATTGTWARPNLSRVSISIRRKKSGLSLMN